jgi:hypothetical protein
VRSGVAQFNPHQLIISVRGNYPRYRPSQELIKKIRLCHPDAGVRLGISIGILGKKHVPLPAPASMYRDTKVDPFGREDIHSQ